MTTRPARDRTALSLAPVFRSCWGSGSSARVPAASSHRLGCGASRRGRGPVPASALLGPARPSRTAALCGPDPAPHTRGDPRRPPRLPPPGNSAAGGARSDWPLLVTRSRLLGAARASIGWRRCQSERASPPAARAALSWGGRCCRASRRLVLVRLRAEQGCRLRGGGRHSGAERRANAAGKLRPRGGKADACLYARPFRLAPEGPTAAWRHGRSSGRRDARDARGGPLAAPFGRARVPVPGRDRRRGGNFGASGVAARGRCSPGGRRSAARSCHRRFAAASGGLGAPRGLRRRRRGCRPADGVRRRRTRAPRRCPAAESGGGGKPSWTGDRTWARRARPLGGAGRRSRLHAAPWSWRSGEGKVKGGEPSPWWRWAVRDRWLWRQRRSEDEVPLSVHALSHCSSASFTPSDWRWCRRALENCQISQTGEQKKKPLDARYVR